MSYPLNISALRRATGISQAELAFRCGINRNRLNLIERGLAEPDGSELSRIAGVLEMPVEALGGTDGKGGR